MKQALMAVVATMCLASCATAPQNDLRSAPMLVADTPAPAKKNPLDLRRTTLIVRDINAALALYRDALGMTVEYDQALTSPRLQRAGSDGANRSRLVLLKANDAFIGMLGLWQFTDQTEFDRRPARPADFTPGTIVLLFNTTDLAATFARAAAAPGVRVISPPAERRYPSPAGEIVVMVSMLVDAEGHTIELNQVLSDPRRS